MKTKTITKKAPRNLSASEKWNILQDYLGLKLSNKEIREKHNLSEKHLEDFIRSLYRRFQNARETKTLIATQQQDASTSELILKQHVDSTQINKAFLDRVSQPTEPLSDHEILFSEFLLEYGDDAKAIEKSKLNVGLKKINGKGHINPEYHDALIMRAFYLKRKANVSRYITEQKKKNLKVLDQGKEYLQSSLIELIDQLRNNNDSRQLPSMLKAIELAGRSIGAFDDKLSIESTSGDDVLDRILKKAKEAKVGKPMLAYTSEDGGTEVYE